jgi:hypothetical protein
MSTIMSCEFFCTHLSERLCTSQTTEIAMNCGEFQASLAYVIDNQWPQEMIDHLHTCPSCDEIVADIRYIISQAQLLMPMLEPSPLVWQRIRKNLTAEPCGRQNKS